MWFFWMCWRSSCAHRFTCGCPCCPVSTSCCFLSVRFCSSVCFARPQDSSFPFYLFLILCLREILALLNLYSIFLTSSYSTSCFDQSPQQQLPSNFLSFLPILTKIPSVSSSSLLSLTADLQFLFVLCWSYRLKTKGMLHRAGCRMVRAQALESENPGFLFWLCNKLTVGYCA